MYQLARFTRVFLLVITIVTMVSLTASAQVTTATILGVVKDPSDALLPGVTVTAKEVNTGVSRTVVSDDRGRYRLSDLPLGSYEVKATLSGFKEFVQKGVSLAIGQEAIINITMQVGAVSEQVTVIGEAPLVETSNAQVAGLVTSTQVRELPLNGRSFDQLALIQAGVQSFKQVSMGPNTSFATRISVSGARIDANNLIMDGIEINDWQRSGGGSAAGLFLGVDAVQEFKVLTHNYSAEFGRSAGAIMNIVTRSGTNTFRSSIYEFLRNDNLDARNFFDREKSTLARNQFGAYLGGRIVRDKAFFSANYEGFRERRGSPLTAFVLSEQARQGITPTGPITVAPQVLPYLAANVMPLPNAGVLAGGLTGRYVFQFKQPVREDYGMGRGDYSLSDRDALFIRYTNDRSSTRTSDSNGVSPFFSATPEFQTQHGVIGYTRIFGPSLVNDFRVGVKRSLPQSESSVDPQFPQDKVTFIPGRPFGRIQFTSTGGQFGQTAGAALSAFGQVQLTPGHWFQTGYQVNDHIVYTRGSHTFKLGAEYELLRDSVSQLASTAPGGAFQFISIQDFLAARPSVFTAPLPTQDPSSDVVQHESAMYVIDDIRMTPRLTANLGFRFEFITSPYDRRPGHTAALVDPLRDTDTSLTPSFFPLPLDNFAPRVGLAWDVFGDGKTSLRSGFGMFYNLLTGRDFEIQLQFAPQFRGTVTVQPPFRNPSFPDEFLVEQAQGFPIFSGRPSGRTQAFYGVRTPTTVQYNLEIQRELTSSAMLRIGYVGTRGYHLISTDLRNTTVPTFLPNGQRFYSAQSRLQNPDLFGILWHDTEGQSWYNSLQMDFRVRATRGLELQANYVWSRNIDNASGNAPADALGTPNNFMDPLDHRRDMSLSALDSRHHFSVNYLYEFPSKSINQIAGRIINGWSLGGILTLATGNPFTGSVGFCRSNVQPSCGADRPDLVPGASNNPVLGRPDRYFDATAFVLQPVGFFGNLGRNTLIGPGFATFDLSVYKKFQIRESKALQFRIEMFNVMNRANFALPATSIFNPSGAVLGTAGVITRTVTNNREIQFGLRFTL